MRRLINSKGFSLAETLIAVGILAILLTFIPFAFASSRNAQRDVQNKADAMLLISTIAQGMEADLSTGSYRGMKNGNVLISSGIRNFDMYFINGTGEFEGRVCFVGPGEVMVPVATDATHTKYLVSQLDYLRHYESEAGVFEHFEYYEYKITILSSITGETITEQIYKVRPYR